MVSEPGSRLEGYLSTLAEVDDLRIMLKPIADSVTLCLAGHFEWQHP